MVQNIVFLDWQSGISGDMFLGAMLDAGLEFATLKTALAALPVTGYELIFEPFHDKGIRGSRFDVIMTEQEQPPRHLSDIAAILHASSLPPRVRETPLPIFQRLPQPEETGHGTSTDEGRFH